MTNRELTKTRRITMRILVFDDNQTHRAAAQAQLKDHDLTVVGTYDEAQKLLTPQFDYEKASAILKCQFGDFNPYRSDDEAKKAEYFAADKLAKEQATTYPCFDVVLTDLLVPASQQAQGSLELVGKEMPVGIFIGLLAAVRARAKYVAIFTDSDHHSHPASACFDVFNYAGGESRPTAFTVEGSKVILSNTGNWVQRFDPQDLSKALEYEEYSKRSDTVRAKNWAALLAHLTA
jgi:CheY-like chemotaxis protein